MANERKSGERRAALMSVFGQIKVRNRVNSLSEHSLAARSQAAKSIGVPLPKTIGTLAHKPYGTPMISVEVVHIKRYYDLQELWQGIRRQGTVKYNAITLCDGRTINHKMFFSGDEVFIVEENKKSKTLRRSILYGSTKTALQRYKSGRIIYDPATVKEVVA